MEDNHPSTDLTHTRIGPPGRGGWNEDSITPSHKRKGETGNIPCSEVSTGSPQVITAVEREIRIKIILPLKIVNLINDFNYRIIQNRGMPSNPQQPKTGACKARLNNTYMVSDNVAIHYFFFLTNQARLRQTTTFFFNPTFKNNLE